MTLPNKTELRLNNLNRCAVERTLLFSILYFKSLLYFLYFYLYI